MVGLLEIMALERWETHIKAKPGQALDDKFFISKSEEVEGAIGITLRYLVVGNGSTRGLEEGVFIQTNVTPEGYNSDIDLRSAIRTHVCLDLMDRSAKAPSITGGNAPQPDFASAISLQQRAVTPNGALVLRLNPADQAEARRMLRDVESGNTRMKFVPNRTVNP